MSKLIKDMATPYIEPVRPVFQALGIVLVAIYWRRFFYGHKTKIQNNPKMEKTTSSPEKDQPVTWQMNESEASYFSEMLNQSITSITERSAV